MRHKAFVILIAFCALVAVAPRALAQAAGGRARAQRQEVWYSCPMHPEVKSKKPGSCPKCKMDLRAVAAATPKENAPPLKEERAEADAQRVSIPDVELLDQDGRTVHFYSDLVKGRTVAIQFIFTTCTTICPPLGATFARVQKDFGERSGRDVHFISVSVDPLTDTPERLKAWGEKFHAGAGWTFVTGAKPQVDALLRALGASSARREDHSPSVLIGNDAKGQWTRAYGLSMPSQLVKLIDDALEGRLEPTSKEGSQ
ncbi:MAG: SCO family protein [Acidobacteria bacterium]|nr:SCO family protein [Acidobacteriota bacterium]